MGKYEKKKRKKSRRWILAVCLLLLTGLLVLFVMPQVLYNVNAEPDLDGSAQSTEMPMPNENGDTAETENPVETESAVEFPAVLDGGNITVESLFSFTGVNPDGNKQDVTDVASIVLSNISDQYLHKATVKVMLNGGTELVFIVSDIPVGASVMAFSVDNDRLLSTDLCTDITAETLYGDAPYHDSVEISVDGMMVTVTNSSSEDLNGIDVYYRDLFDDKYFGGMTYSKSIEHLPAGESVTFTAEESLLGVIEVVRIAVNDKN